MYLTRHGHSEQEIEEAVVQRKPVAARALYTLIGRRLQEGLGWPDRNYNNSVTSMVSVTKDSVKDDGSSDVVVLGKLGRHEPLLPGRRDTPRQSSSLANYKLTREKQHYVFDEQLVVRGSMTNGLTPDALNELVPQSRFTSRKSIHEILARKPPAVAGAHVDPTDEQSSSPRPINSNGLATHKPSISPQRENVLIAHQPVIKQPRSVPNSTLDHTNQNGFYLSNDPNGSRVSKAPSRISQVDQSKKSPDNSPVRYHPSKLNIIHFKIFPLSRIFLKLQQ